MCFNAFACYNPTSNFLKSDIKSAITHCLSYVLMSDSIVKQELIAISIINVVILQRDSAILQRGFAILQRDVAILQLGSVILQLGSAMLQRGSAMLQRGSAILQRGFAILQRDSAILQCGCRRSRFRKSIVINYEQIYQLKLI